MGMTLRPYQEQAITTVVEAAKREKYVLLQAATGAGKTIFFCELVRRWREAYPSMRIAILAHRAGLITQTAGKMLKVWPGAPLGLACASVGRVNHHAPVVIGSIQTLANRAKVNPFHLVIVDEAHRLDANDKSNSQYLMFIRGLERLYPDLRVLGVTATPFRLGHGYIYGPRCKEGRQNLFPDLHYSVSMAELQAQGFLVPLRAKEGDTVAAALSGVKTTGGDYNQGQLSAVMEREIHIQSAVEAYQKYGEGRTHCVIFCVTIEHAEKVMTAFRAAGYATGCVHSQMGDKARDKALADFAAGRIQILTNVGVLTEGWDCPETDLVMLCRPTKSPALFVQMVGRGLRLADGKSDLLCLDLADNFATHGDPNDPRVIVPGLGEAGSAPHKSCPKCQSLVAAGCLECPDCGFLWQITTVEKAGPVAMRDVPLNPDEYSVVNVWISEYQSFKGHLLARATVTGRHGGRTTQISNYFDFAGQASPYGRKKAHLWWRKMSGLEPPPLSVAEAVERQGELTYPETVIVKREGDKGQWRKIAGW
jgi:DNA repair protein RadD